MVMQQAETKKTNDWLTNMEQEEVELKTKVEKLERHITNSVPTDIKELKVTDRCHYSNNVQTEDAQCVHMSQLF